MTFKILFNCVEHDFVTKTKSGKTANAKYSAQDIPQDEAESIGWLITHVLNESERQIITRAAASGIGVREGRRICTVGSGEIRGQCSEAGE